MIWRHCTISRSLHPVELNDVCCCKCIPTPNVKIHCSLCIQSYRVVTDQDGTKSKDPIIAEKHYPKTTELLGMHVHSLHQLGIISSIKSHSCLSHTSPYPNHVNAKHPVYLTTLLAELLPLTTETLKETKHRHSKSLQQSASPVRTAKNHNRK